MSKPERIVGASCAVDIHSRDCLEALDDPSLVPPGSVDVVVTSPPYNLGVRYSSYDDTISREEYLDWLQMVDGDCREYNERRKLPDDDARDAG